MNTIAPTASTAIVRAFQVRRRELPFSFIAHLSAGRRAG